MSENNKRNALFDKLFKKENDRANDADQEAANEYSVQTSENEQNEEYEDWFTDTVNDDGTEDDISDTIEALFGDEADEGGEAPTPTDEIYISWGSETADEAADEIAEEIAQEYVEEAPQSSYDNYGFVLTDEPQMSDEPEEPAYDPEPELEPEFAPELEPEFEPEAAFADDDYNGNSLEDEAVGEEALEPEEEISIFEDEPQEAPERAVDEDTANLLRALGYEGAASERVKKAPPRPESTKARASDLSMAFAYEGKEFTSRSQISDIKRAYSRDRKQVMIRLIGTILFTVLLAIYDIFGKSFGGALDVSVYPVVNILMSLQLLLIASVFSIRQIYAGIDGIIKSKPIFHSISATAFVLTVVYDIVLAIAAPESFTLYNFPAAVCLLFSVAHDYFVLEREIYVFDRLSSWPGIVTLERVDSAELAAELGEARVGSTSNKIGDAFRLRKGEFAENYFRHINRPHPTAKVINYLIILPVLALSLIFALISVASRNSFVDVCNTFMVVNLICLPSAMLVTMTYPFFALIYKLLNADSVVFSESDVSEYKNVDTVVFDEDDLFDEGSLTINRISVCDKNRMQDVFDIMCAVSALYSRIGGRIAGAFKASTADAEEPEDVRVLNVVDGGFEGIAGEHRYVVGSDAYLTSHGIPVMRYYDDKYIASNHGGVVLHIAVDGVEVFKLYLTYRITDSMLGFINELPDNNIRIVMRTIDPNINIDLITRLLANGFNGDLTLVRKPYSEAEAQPVAQAPFEGGMLVNAENPESVIDVVKCCRGYHRVAKLNFYLSIVAYALGAILSICLGVIGSIVGLSSMIVFLFQLLSVIPCFVLIHLILTK